MNLKEEFLHLAQTLDDAQIPYALCGGLALAIHGFARFTEDVDFLILPDDLERTQAAVEIQGFNFPSGLIPLGRATGNPMDLYRFTKIKEKDFLSLALILVNSLLEEVWKERQIFILDEQKIWVVSRKGLIRMKRLAGRSQDKVDIERLQEIGADPEYGIQA